MTNEHQSSSMNLQSARESWNRTRGTKAKSKPWIYGEVVGKPAPRSCAVSTPLGLVRRNHVQIRKASTSPVHGYGEPIPIDTDVAPDTSGQVGDPPISNNGGEQMEQPEHENAGQMEQPEYEDPEHASPEYHPGTGGCPPGSRIM